MQRDWNDPNLVDWSSRVRRDINRIPGKILIVAHSFGVLAAVQAASDHNERIAGALLVAPADPEKFDVADYMPVGHLGFPSVVVASTDDHWMSLARAAHWADLWGSDLVNLGASGHINEETGFGPWSEGLEILQRLRRASEFKSVQAFKRSSSRVRFTEDRRQLKQAAALLKEAGWQVQAGRRPEDRRSKANQFIKVILGRIPEGYLFPA